MMLPVFALGGFGAIWGLVRVYTPEEIVATSAWSPDHHYRSSIVQVYGSEGCGSANSSMVVVERSNFFIHTGSFSPFCLEDSPNKIELHWMDAQTLVIDCAECNQHYTYVDENWGKLHFIYDLDRP
jgi:hypothetical protein